MKDRKYDAGLLSDVDIREFLNNGISITASGAEGYFFDPDKQIQFGSIDLHFRHDCKRMKLMSDGVIDYEDLKHHSYTESFDIINDELYIEPGEIILTTTQEIVNISPEFAGIVTGRSSIARLGVMVHCCQEFINPGHGQTIPLQLVNLGDNTVRIPISSTVCQLVLFKLRTPSSGSYATKKDAKYADEVEPISSKLYVEFEPDAKTPSTVEKEITTETRKTKKIIENKKQEEDKRKKFWSTLLSPILASLITALLTSSFFINTVNDTTVYGIVAAIFTFLGNIHIVFVCIVVLVIVYYFCTKWGMK